MADSKVFVGVIIVLAVLCVGLIVAVICVALLPGPDIVSLTEFTAQTLSFKYYGYQAMAHETEISNEVTFSDYKWYSESSNGDISFSTKDDDMITTCMHLVGHDNCYVRSFSGVGGFHIPHYAKAVQKNELCEKVSPVSYNFISGRKLKNCDLYTFGEGNMLFQFVVESESNYPVEQRITSFDYTGPYTVFKAYLSFDEGKPKSDEKKLKPFDGVTVYDFRDGKGDAGNGKSNVFEGTSFAETFSKISRVHEPRKDNVKLLFDKVERHADVAGASIRKQAIRDFLRLPPHSFSGMQSFPTKKSQMRIARDIPSSFDARKQWSDCSNVINTITNQNPCGSCWAMSSTGVLSDRLCITHNEKVQLSPRYLMECSYNNSGCQGGSAKSAWSDLMAIGTVPESCVPFQARNGDCPSFCEDGKIIDDSIKVRPTSFVMPWGKTAEERVKAIQTEIMTNGPVQASYWVFSDFEHFFEEKHDRIYHRSLDATFDGGHAVRIIGWGTENGEDYWLVANSWGTGWGDKGFFKIRRGNNECDFEEIVAAGLFA